MATHVAVVIPRCGDKMLLIYNTKWRAFTFPMTKLPPWEFVDTSQIADTERKEIVDEQLRDYWLDAAAHAVVECLGQPNHPQPLLEGPIEVEYTDVQRSGRDGADRVYNYKIFTLEVEKEFASRVQPFAWLTSDEIRSGKFRPLSPTVMAVLNRREVRDMLRQV